MLHELLFALSGNPGSVFVKNPPTDDIQVVADLPFLHESEAAILNRLCTLASYYVKFQTFIDKYSGLCVTAKAKLIQQPLGCKKDESVDSGIVTQRGVNHSADPGTGEVSGEGVRLRDGLYLRSFCNALDSALADYRKIIVAIEYELMSDPHLTLTYIQRSLEEYQLLFPDIDKLLQDLITFRAHGSYILEIIHRHSSNGKPVVREIMSQILHHCHGVMYKQLSSWLLYGLLLDPYDEFFIQKWDSDSAPPPLDSGEEESELPIGGLSGNDLRSILKISEDTLDIVDTSIKFSVHADLLPAYIPSWVADKIVFIGESVRMFEHDLKRPSGQRKTGTILKNQEEKFAAKMRMLQEEKDFNIRHFEVVIDDIRQCVAEHLWVLVVEDSDVIGHLKKMKDLFLLGRGELYQTFIDIANHLLNTPPTQVTEHDVNVAFKRAANQVLLDDTILNDFQLTIDTAPSKDDTAPSSKKGAKSGGGGEIGWNLLSISYNVQWPLHIILSSGQEKYNIVFKFLLHVKRVQNELNQSWAVLMNNKHNTLTQQHTLMWQIRSHMSFFIDNLQYYLQVDVLESHFSVLLQKIGSVRDFEKVCLAHDAFLNTVLSQCFVLLKPVYHSIIDVLDHCHAFCRLITRTHDSPITDRDIALIEKISKNFSCQTALLFRVLSSVHTLQSPHLALLMLRLDFNRYFSQKGALACMKV